MRVMLMPCSDIGCNKDTKAPDLFFADTITDVLSLPDAGTGLRPIIRKRVVLSGSSSMLETTIFNWYNSAAAELAIAAPSSPSATIRAASALLLTPSRAAWARFSSSHSRHCAKACGWAYTVLMFSS